MDRDQRGETVGSCIVAALVVAVILIGLYIGWQP